MAYFLPVHLSLLVEFESGAYFFWSGQEVGRGVGYEKKFGDSTLSVIDNLIGQSNMLCGQKCVIAH